MSNSEFINLAQRSGDFVRWIGDCVDHLKVPKSARSVRSLPLIHVSLSHHAAIVHLLARGGGTSAFALLRPQLDAYLRGVWLRQVASDEAIEALNQPQAKLPKAMIAASALEKSGLFDQGTLTKIVGGSWNTLSDFTHAGLMISSAHFTGDEVKEAHSSEMKAQVLLQSNVWASMALIDLYNHTSDPSKAGEVIVSFEEHFKR